MCWDVTSAVPWKDCEHIKEVHVGLKKKWQGRECTNQIKCTLTIIKTRHTETNPGKFIKGMCGACKEKQKKEKQAQKEEELRKQQEEGRGHTTLGERTDAILMNLRLKRPAWKEPKYVKGPLEY